MESFQTSPMPLPPNRRRQGGSAPGHSIGAKDADPAGKIKWILQYNDVKMEILVKHKGVLPSDRQVYRELKRSRLTEFFVIGGSMIL